MRANKESLLDLVDKVNWLQIVPSYGRGHSVSSNEHVSVGFSKSKPSKPDLDRIRIIIGKDIMDKLGWLIGERVIVYHNPDYLMQLKIVKSDSNTGYKLAKDNNFGRAAVQFSWQHELKLVNRPLSVIEHVAYKRQLMVDMNAVL